MVPHVLYVPRYTFLLTRSHVIQIDAIALVKFKFFKGIVSQDCQVSSGFH